MNRPETLEQCLEWLIGDVDGVISSWNNVDGNRVVSAVGEVFQLTGTRHPHGMATVSDGDISAAVVAAVVQVWNQVHGEDDE